MQVLVEFFLKTKRSLLFIDILFFQSFPILFPSFAHLFLYAVENNTVRVLDRSTIRANFPR